MSKHTPGPWLLITYGVDDPQDWTVVSGAGRFIADFPRLIWDEREQQAADARLIAASPDLLEALQQIALMDGTEENEWDAVERLLPEIVRISRAAIAKATQ